MKFSRWLHDSSRPAPYQESHFNRR
jgi:hypothetical protein